jgi:glycosyltransferase involved in cell wall biosynthesis
VRSGISDYSVDLLPHLSEHADVRVVAVPGQRIADEVRLLYAPVPIERLGEDGRVPLYQMGNNQYHEEIRRAALRLPGVMTLHDVVLHHQLLGRTVGEGDHLSYRADLQRDHGWAGAAVSRSAYWGAIGHAAQFELPAHRALLRSQRGVLVHSDWAAGVIEDENEGVPVRVVPMPIPLPPPADAARAEEFRARHGLPLGAPLLGSFGFQTPIKRTEIAVRALAQPGLESVHLVVAGELSPHVEIVETALELGVADRVHVLGFLGYDDFEAGIAACDLCLNLRYPSAGETSASLLRVLAIGRPVIVSAHGQFAEMPDAIAVRIPLGDGEVETLTDELRRLIADPARLRTMGERARAYVAAEHDPGKSARRIAEAVAELSTLAPPGPAPHDEPRRSSLIERNFSGEILVEGAERPWPAGERRRLRVVVRNDGDAVWLAGEHGEGGIAIETRVSAEEEAGPSFAPWCPLPRDLRRGESWSFELDVRRPRGAARLRIEPRILAREGFSYFGGPVWESPL